jgi:C-terminal peptidase prc
MKKIFFITLAALILNSCGGSSYTYDKGCSVDEQNEYVYNYMQKNYLWYSDMPELDYREYGSVYDLFIALKVTKDKWSFIVDKEVFDSYFSGDGYIGFGFKFSKIGSKFFIQYVFDNSPAIEANIQRGDELLKIDGKELSALDKEEAIEIFGERKVGVSKTLTIKKKDGSIENITLSKKNIKVASVLQHKIIKQNGKKIGYLLFDRFIEPSTKELYDAFGYFKKEGIDELVIDLRYNGGGLVNVAGALASLIRADDNNKLLFTLQFNDKNRQRDMSYHLRTVDNSLHNINKVYFLTTNSSCSASEAVINGLKPYLNDIIVIGSKTYGKPVGMVGGEFCGKYIVPIEFEILNSQGEGRYFDGINPTSSCQVGDDLSHNLGDPSETMLKQALYHIEYGSCNSSYKKMARQIQTEDRENINGLNSIINAY